jgi:predicted PurR-regulated permease PerM
MLPRPRTPSPVDHDAAPSAEPLRNAAAGAIVGAIVVAFLYVGRDVLIPLALTTLISFVLGPLVSWLRRFVGLRMAVALAVLLAVLVVSGIASLVAWQVTDLAGNIGKYRTNLQQKVDALRDGGGVLANAIGSLRELAYELTRAQAASGAPAQPPPMRVELAGGPGTALDQVLAFLVPVVLPLLMAGLVIILVAFMLLEREPLRDRLIRLVSRGDISRTTEAINDAAARLSRFLAAQLLINVGFGAVVTAGLWLLGVPNPLVWGLLSGVLRFVPYAGNVIGALMASLAAIAVSPDWTLPLMTLGFMAGCEIVAGQVVEPLLYGSSTGMSPLAVLVSTIVWAALWGPIGLLLAMPLTVCLVVLGRHVPQLEFLGVLLADAPALSVEDQIYHRLLAYAPFDAAAIAVEYAREYGVPPLLDKVLVDVLALAENDRRRGVLDVDRQRRIAEGIDEIVEAVSDEPDEPASARDGENQSADMLPKISIATVADATSGQGRRREAPVLCIAARTDLDRAAASLVAERLQRRNIPAQIVMLTGFAGHGTAEAQPAPQAIVLCIVLPASPMTLQHIVRRVRQRSGPTLPVIIAGLAPPTASATAAELSSRPSPVARTPAETIDLIDQLQRPARRA